MRAGVTNSIQEEIKLMIGISRPHPTARGFEVEGIPSA